MTGSRPINLKSYFKSVEENNNTREERVMEITLNDSKSPFPEKSDQKRPESRFLSCI